MISFSSDFEALFGDYLNINRSLRGSGCNNLYCSNYQLQVCGGIMNQTKFETCYHWNQVSFEECKAGQKLLLNRALTTEGAWRSNENLWRHCIWCAGIDYKDLTDIDFHFENNLSTLETFGKNC